MCHKRACNILATYFRASALKNYLSGPECIICTCILNVILIFTYVCMYYSDASSKVSYTREELREIATSPLSKVVPAEWKYLVEVFPSVCLQKVHIEQLVISQTLPHSGRIPVHLNIPSVCLQKVCRLCHRNFLRISKKS
jgi:hypothetical protein